MSTMRDAMSQKLEEINSLIDASAQTRGMTESSRHDEVDQETDKAGESLLAPDHLGEVDETSFGLIIQKRMVKRENRLQSWIAEDASLAKILESIKNAEAYLCALYAEKPALEGDLATAQEQLAHAKKDGFTTQVIICEARIEGVKNDIEENNTIITFLERKYPDAVSRLKNDRMVVERHKTFLNLFTTETTDGLTRYTASETPTPEPTHAGIKAARDFLEARIQEAVDGSLIIGAQKGAEVLFVASDGTRWTTAHKVPDADQICNVLLNYQNAIEQAYQARLQHIAKRDIKDGLLLPPNEVKKMKNDPLNRDNILDLVERKGFCFVPMKCSQSDLAIYREVPAEMLVKHVEKEKATDKLHAIRIVAVTVPHVVDEIFFTNEGKYRNLTFCFNNPYEIQKLSGWARFHETLVGQSLIGAVKKAEFEKADAKVFDALAATRDVKQMNKLADGEVGNAVLLIKRYQNRFDLGIRLVSDGTTIRPNLATEMSKKTRLYEEVQDGAPIAEFFARNGDGSFVNEDLETIAILNEPYEFEQLIPDLLTKYNAQRVSANNILDFAMPAGNGGSDGTYLLDLLAVDKSKQQDDKDKKVYLPQRQVAYIITRSGDDVRVITGLTKFSSENFTRQGFLFNTPYNLNEIRGYILYLFQKSYGQYTGTPRESMPTHLLSGKITPR